MDDTAEPGGAPEPAPGGAHGDFAAEMSYGDYLALDRLLACQTPRSDSHDEMLFIVIHQSAELWMKLAIHELSAARDLIAADRLGPCFKMLARVARIQSQLIHSWDVLTTLTPADYMTFREQLGKSSGFQSYSYRTIELLLGSKNPALLAPHRHRPDLHDPLHALLHRRSLYDEVVHLLARRGFAIAPEHLGRDVAGPYTPHPSVKAAWLEVYRHTDRHWDLYELAEKLVDLEDWLQLWRYRHVRTVQRVIGFKRGTGGTAGVAYLKRLVDQPFFHELWDIRTEV
ncbi:MAG TPA: tryptophan 2,3-dioxygenase [Alphaproteobacteria bacterium]|nr:tryptophan 2,3-dioxygenase [Alphaproteobacteria bacterium]